jgi:hypothetical protein
LHNDQEAAEAEAERIKTTYRWVYKKHTRGAVAGEWSVEDTRSLIEADALVTQRRHEQYDEVRHDPQDAFVNPIPFGYEISSDTFCTQ